MQRSLSERLRGLVAELAKFAVVGGVCLIVDFGLSLFCRFELGLGPNTSKGIGTIVATALSYVGNRLWSFAHRVEDDAGHGEDLFLYAVINALGLVITLIPVSVAHYLLDQQSGLAFTISGIIGTGLATIFRFWAYRKFVFSGNKDQAERLALV